MQPVALSTTLNLAPVESLTISAFGSSNIHYVGQGVREPSSQGANQHWIDATCTRLRLTLKRKEPTLMRRSFSHSPAGAGKRLVLGLVCPELEGSAPRVQGLRSMRRWVHHILGVNPRTQGSQERARNPQPATPIALAQTVHYRRAGLHVPAHHRGGFPVRARTSHPPRPQHRGERRKLSAVASNAPNSGPDCPHW